MAKRKTAVVKAPTRKRPHALFVRLDAGEMDVIRAYADRLGLPAAAWARRIILDAIERDAGYPAPK